MYVSGFTTDIYCCPFCGRSYYLSEIDGQYVCERCGVFFYVIESEEPDTEPEESDT